ncbi:hypothetical protein EVAR_64511_1 [Eumeta japonica]|uniref:Uncharacterized protein n=1 Tax=Eumeta variegata TaxID=151549 RepID=A0A4C1Z2Q0_EUMVA|nr:hypothetical protein EVAR_64511_1 [Eumeta japonica]
MQRNAAADFIFKCIAACCAHDTASSPYPTRKMNFLRRKILSLQKKPNSLHHTKHNTKAINREPKILVQAFWEQLVHCRRHADSFSHIFAQLPRRWARNSQPLHKGICPFSGSSALLWPIVMPNEAEKAVRKVLYDYPAFGTF